MEMSAGARSEQLKDTSTSVIIESMISKRPNAKTRMRNHTKLRLIASGLIYKKLIVLVSISAFSYESNNLNLVANANLLNDLSSKALQSPSQPNDQKNDTTLTRIDSIANASLASLNTLTSVPIKLDSTNTIQGSDTLVIKKTTDSLEPRTEYVGPVDSSPKQSGDDVKSKRPNSYTLYEHQPSASYATVSHASSTDDYHRISPSIGTSGPSVEESLSTDEPSSSHVLDALMHRDHHHQYHQPQTNVRVARDESSTSFNFANHSTQLSNSLKGKLGVDDKHDLVQHQLPHNHNYGPAAESNQQHAVADSSNNLNTELIQNLTSSLFPKRSLSNATLQSLSELLTKTKQLQQQKQSDSLNQQVHSSYESPIYYQPSMRLQQPYYNSSFYGRHLNETNKNLDALLNEHTYGLLGFLNTENNRFGFRDNNYHSHNNHHQHHSQLSPTSAQSKQHFTLYDGPKSKHTKSDLLYSKTPSNIYNTYLPYAGSSSANIASAQSPIMMTNGQQALNFALYQSLLNDEPTIKWPLSMNKGDSSNNNTSKYGSLNHNLRGMVNNMHDQYSPTGSQTVNGYQYIQQQSSPSNQNQLDRLTYHSTPFRPAIASLASSFQSSGSQQQVLNNFTTSNSNKTRYLDSTGASRQSMLGLPDALSSTHSMSSAPSDTSINAPGRYLTKAEAARAAQSNAADRNTAHRATPTGQDYDTSSEMRSRNQSMLSQQPNSSQYQTSAAASNQSQSSSTKQQQHQQPITIHSGAPAILFELYEREIDNQIREAIQADHQQHHSHLGPALLNMATASSNWLGSSEVPTSPLSSLASTLSNSLIHEGAASSASNIAALPFGAQDKPFRSIASAPISPFTYAAQPMFPYYTQRPPSPWSGSPMQAASSTTSSTQVPAISSQSNQPTDSLAAALQDLPTFTAADLQPLVSNSAGISGLPSYSMLSVSHQKPEPAYSESSPSSSLLPSSAESWFTANTGEFYPPPFVFPEPTLANDLSKVYSHNYQHNQPHHSSNNAINNASNSHTIGQSYGSGGGTGGLSAMLFRLPPGPLTSILTSPFSHLYANLPRYRYGKKQPSSQSSSASQTSASNASLKGFWSMLGNAAGNDIVVRDSTSFSDGKQHKTTSNKYQSNRIAAILAANLLAASGSLNTGQQINPMQLASLVQLHANLMEQPNNQLSNDLASSPDSSQVNPYLMNLLESTSMDSVAHAESPETWANSFLPTGSAITPQTWRSIQSAMQWNRKWQQHQPQSFSNPYEAQKPTPSASKQHSTSSTTSESSKLNNGSSGLFGRHISTPLSLLLGGASTPLTHLLGPSGGSSQSLLAPAPTETTSLRISPPRLKIKILKVPVAVYDNGSELRGAAATTQLAQGYNLLPAHLQSALAASLHAHLPCAAFHQAAAAASASGGTPPSSSPSIISPTTSTAALNNHRPQYFNPLASLAAGSQTGTTSPSTLIAQGIHSTISSPLQSSSSSMASSGLQGSTPSQSSSSSSSSSSPISSASALKLAHRNNDALIASFASHANFEKPPTAQIQSFTDINQPTDLQVAPALIQSKYQMKNFGQEPHQNINSFSSS